MPRPDIVAVEDDGTLRDVQALMLEHGYSRIPVFREDLDDVTGVVLRQGRAEGTAPGQERHAAAEVVREAHFVPETKKVADLLAEMQQREVPSAPSSPTSTAR